MWFTVADGVLSDVYSPTSDNTNLDTLQYLVSDGRSFTDLQTRDMTYTVRSLDRTGVSCQVVATADSHAYRLVTDYLTDPLRDSVVMHTTFVPLHQGGPCLPPLRALRRDDQRRGRRRQRERRRQFGHDRPGRRRRRRRAGARILLERSA